MRRWFLFCADAGGQISSKKESIACRYLLRKTQVPPQKREGPDPVDGMRPIEEFDFGPVRDSHFCVKPADLCVLVRDPFVGRDTVVMASLYHEWTQCHKICKIGVIDDVCEVELQHGHVAVARVGARCLPDPFVKVR